MNLAWTVSKTEVVEEESFVKALFLVLIVEEWLQRGPMWLGSLEDKGGIEARERG